MPIIKTTPVTTPDKTHTWITGFTVEGLEPGGVPALRIQLGEAYIAQSGAPQILTITSAGVSGPAAVAFFQQHAALYQEMKLALYQLVLDQGVDQGTIE